MSAFATAIRSISESLHRHWLPVRERYARWIGKGINSILDEGSISGSNFLISVMLARWLPAAQYGGYVLAFSIFLLLSSLQQTLILEPMMVFAPACYSDRMSGYVRALLKFQILFSVPVVVLLAAAAGICSITHPGGGLSGAFLGLAFAGPCILAFWLARAACYIEVRPGPAAVSAVLYSGTVLGGLFLVYRLGHLSPVVAFLLMGAGAFIASVLLFIKLRALGASSKVANRSFPDLWKQHWSYGHWELGTLLAGWVSENVWYLLAASCLGMAEVGALRALTNVFLPPQRTVLALRRLLLPYLSGKSGKHGPAAVKGAASTIALLSGLGILGYCIVAFLLRKPIFEILYAGKFHEYGYLLLWVGMPIVFSSAAQGYGLAVRAAQSPSLYFYASVAEAGVFVLLSVPATLLFGLVGIVASACGSKFVLLLVSARLANRATSQAPPKPATESARQLVAQMEAPDHLI